MNHDQNNVKELMQFGKNSTKYRHDYSMSMELRDELLANVYLKLIYYAYDHHYDESAGAAFNQFMDEHDLSDENTSNIHNLLFWWRTLYLMKREPGLDIIQDFINDNRDYFNDWPILKSWLNEWYNIVPGFYFNGAQFGENGYVMVDTKNHTPLDVFYPLPTFEAPSKGTIVAGFLLPFCDSLYFPLVEFYPFDSETKKEIAQHIKYYYEQTKSNPDEFNVFMNMFSHLLKVEKNTLSNLNK